MADIRNTEKPNVLSADKSGFGELVTPASGWTTQAPDTDDDVEDNQDPYTPQMLGGPDHMDHNSEFLKGGGEPVD
jgi:hypothetical protein